MAKKVKKAEIHNILKDKKLPILTLDNRWHELFQDEQKPLEIRELEQQVNDLLKKQGKLVNDIKDMKKLKSNLLQDIMEHMEISNHTAGTGKDKKLGKNKQYITELNVKIEQAMDDLGEIPYEIKKVNEALMAESIQLFYTQLNQNHRELEEVTAWVNSIREELKHKILLKQDLEVKNTKLYTYMHDVLGHEIMEYYDREQNDK